MYTIYKQFDFCYGHRVWSQALDSNFAIDACLACRHIHGHQGTIKVHLQAEKLEAGMVTDFKHLGWFKKWLDDTLDHKFIMDINDPLLSHEVPDLKFGEVSILFGGDLAPIGSIQIDPKVKLIQAVREKYEGMVFVDFVPTSENLSKWIFNIVQRKMKPLNVTVSSVEFLETPKSSSTYSI